MTKVKRELSEIPLTKSGLPNKLYLTKAQKLIVKEFEDKIKLDKDKVDEKNIKDLLSSLFK